MVSETSPRGWKCLPPASFGQSCHCLLSICDTNNTFFNFQIVTLLVDGLVSIYSQTTTLVSNIVKSKILPTSTLQSQHSPNKLFNSWFTFRNGSCVLFFFTLCCEVSPLCFRTCFSIVWRLWCCCSLVCQMCQADLISNRISWKQLSTMG